MDKVINSIAKNIAVNLVSHNKIQSDKLELYEYSSLIAIQSAINIIAMLILGFVFGEFLENICFFIAYKVLRKYSGGFHSSKFSTCFFISLVSNAMILISIKAFSFYPNYLLAIIIEIVSFLIIIFFAPITNVNKPISKKEYSVFKLIMCVVSLLFIGISIVLCLTNSIFVFAISLAMLLNSLFVLIEILKSRYIDKYL